MYAIRSYYVNKSGHIHLQEIVKGKKAHEVLKWTHILISNAKSFIIGTFHRFGKKHLQSYLDEFCYRFNRRKWELQLFDSVITSYSIHYTKLYEIRIRSLFRAMASNVFDSRKNPSWDENLIPRIILNGSSEKVMSGFIGVLRITSYNVCYTKLLRAKEI